MNETNIADWNKFNRNRKINAFDNLSTDTIYTTTYYDTLDAELEPYRELKAAVTIQGKRYAYTGRINLVETQDLIKSIGILFLTTISILLIGLFFITKKCRYLFGSLSIKLFNKLRVLKLTKPENQNLQKQKLKSLIA